MQQNAQTKTIAFDPALTHRLVARFDLQGHLLLETDSGQSLELASTIKQLSEQKRLQREIAVVWVPTQQVVMTHVHVPGNRKSLWMAALPYALEETLSSSVDEYHVLALHRNKQEQVAAMAVSLNSMQTWQEALDEYGLGHAILVADCFRIPFESKASNNRLVSHDNDSKDVGNEQSSHTQVWFICQNPYVEKSYVENSLIEKPSSEVSLANEPAENNQFLIRTSEHQGFATNETWLAVLKSQYVKQSEVSQQLIEHAIPAHELLSSSQASLFKVKALTLSQGEFRPATQNQTNWREWRWVGVLSVLIVVVWLAMQVMQTQQLEKQALYTQQQTEKLFKTMFPETKRIVNIKSQTLTKLRQSDGQNRDGQRLMPLLQQVEKLLLKQPKVKLVELTWDPKKPNALVLQAEASASADLEGLISASKASGSSLSLRLSLKNVTSDLAEGVIYVDAN